MCPESADLSWILSKDVALAVQYKVYLVKRVISLVDTAHYSKGHGLAKSNDVKGGGSVNIFQLTWDGFNC